MEIRRATIEDLADIFTCNINAFKNYITLINRAPAPMMTDFSAELKNNHLFVACENDEVLGFALIQDTADDYMWLDVLAVQPEHQGKGIGRSLLDFTEQFILTKGKSECRLNTNVKFKRTLGIYLQYGFEIYDTPVVHGYERHYLKKNLK
ncbi:MAG: GNAT family N-acetyltransferase [Peptococcaceae bacterium]|nr:GNAT family N-acetyltransferase [Peptococcaceae bacterium]MBR2627708.1 GNAT family N-acetyltransferase [Peptococcaceae bacterium]